MTRSSFILQREREIHTCIQWVTIWCHFHFCVMLVAGLGLIHTDYTQPHIVNKREGQNESSLSHTWTSIHGYILRSDKWDWGGGAWRFLLTTRSWTNVAHRFIQIPLDESPKSSHVTRARFELDTGLWLSRFAKFLREIFFFGGWPPQDCEGDRCGRVMAPGAQANPIMTWQFMTLLLLAECNFSPSIFFHESTSLAHNQV